MSLQPDHERSEFESYVESIAEEHGTFTVVLSEDRPALVFRKTRNWDDLTAIRRRVEKAIASVKEGTFPPPWKPYIGDDITPVGQSVWMADRHVGYLKWLDCEKPAEDDDKRFRNVGDEKTPAWQELVVVEKPSSEYFFLQLSAKDPHAFQALAAGFFANVSCGWTSADVDYFRKATEAL